MTFRLVVELPPRFYDDHVDRDLPSGEVIHRTAKSVTVMLTEDEWAELRSDAEHYADWCGGGLDDPCYLGLVTSARAMLRRLPTEWPNTRPAEEV